MTTVPSRARQQFGALDGRPAPPPPIGSGTSFEQFWNAVTYVYLLRVPLIIWALLVALPVLALRDGSPAAPLLRGLFDIVDPEVRWATPAFAFVTLASLMVAATLALTARLILCDGADRFDITGPHITGGVELAIRLVALLVPISIVAGASVQSVKVVGVGAAAGGTAIGILAFYLLMTRVHPWLWHGVFATRDREAGRRVQDADQGDRPADRPDRPAGPPAVRQGLLARAIVAVINVQLAALIAIVRRTPHGFVGADGRLLARHAFAFFQFLLSLALYGALFVLKASWLFGGGAPRVPTLCLVLVLAMMLCWGLTALSFILDRFRVPILTLLLVYGAVVAVFPQSDHYFQSLRLPPGTSARTVRASDVLARRDGKPAIVVAATGGGIQAAGWAARVLAGLQLDARACGSDFDQAMVAISSVSGGSVGAMFVLDSYRNGRMQVGATLDESVAVKAAEASSLDEIAWGLVYPDLAWGAVPFLKGVGLRPPTLVKGSNLTSDRGSALEDTWKRQGTLLSHATLDGWGHDLADGTRPAAMFNATVAETGERFVFGTTAFEWDGFGRRDFWTSYPGLDVPITTAARLSATFPYVSPAARILSGGIFEPAPHLVDGGYYDNYGTSTLVDWLDQGLRSLSDRRPAKVLLLQIRSAPVGLDDRPQERRGWIFDALQPLTTMFAVRGTGQLSHSDIDIDLIERERYLDPPIPVSTIVIQFPDRFSATELASAPPLSWHLTPADRGRLHEAWNLVKDDRIRVNKFLGVDRAEDCVR